MNLKKIFFPFIFLFFLYSVAFSQESSIPENDSFLSVEFGSTKDEIKTYEKDSSLILEKEFELIFNKSSKLFGKFQNSYNFGSNGKMIASMINIANEYKDLSYYIDEYNKVNDFISKQYGKPILNTISTDDETILKDSNKLAEAIKEGSVNYLTKWKNENFSITHILLQQLPDDDLDEEYKKIMISLPINHMILIHLNAEEELDETPEDGEIIE